MVLEGMTLAGDVGLDGLAVRELHTGDLPLGRVRLFGFGDEDRRDDTLLVGVTSEQGRPRPLLLALVVAPHSLVERYLCRRRCVEEPG